MHIKASKGPPVELQIANLDALLDHCYKSSVFFRQNILNALDAHPSGLTLVLYHDSCTAGNPVRSLNNQKTILFYVSFKEFQSHGNLGLWLPAALIREAEANRCEGGFSHLLRMLFHSWLQTPNSLFTCGVPLKYTHQACLLRVESFILLGDELALKTSMDAKGASGFKPCLKCKNILKTDMQLGHQSYLVHHWESDPRKFDLYTNQEVWEVVDHVLATATSGVSKAVIKQLTIDTGFKPNFEGWLADTALRNHFPPSSIMYDAMHIYWSGGIVGSELSMLLEKLSPYHEQLESFMFSDWGCAAGGSPHHSSPWQRRFWFQRCILDKAFASELFSVVPPIGFFIAKGNLTIEPVH